MQFEVTKYSNYHFFVQLFPVPDFFTESMSGSQMIPTPSGDGAILTHHAEVFELICETEGCQWKEKRHKLLHERENHVMMYVPDDLCQ